MAYIIRVLTKRVCMKDNYYRHINGVPYKIHCFIEMQFAAYFYTVVPYQTLIRLPIYKNSAISKSGAIFFFFLSFCKIRDFGSPTIRNTQDVESHRNFACLQTYIFVPSWRKGKHGEYLLSYWEILIVESTFGAKLFIKAEHNVCRMVRLAICNSGELQENCRPGLEVLKPFFFLAQIS